MGYVTLRTALAHSLNVATVKVAEMVGYDRVADLWNTKLGMRRNVQPYPAIALGSFEATPLEMADRLQRARQRRPEGGAGHGAERGRRARTQRSSSTSAAARRAWSRAGVGVPRHQHDAQRAQRRHRRRRARHGLHAPTPRARPAPPTTCATPGSPASRPTCSAWSGWASTTTRRSTSPARARRCPSGSTS